MTSISVLLTCYNRKDTTLRCLSQLRGASLPPGVSLNVYLVDDASPDGTGEAVGRDYPEVRLLRGSGNLYWAGGMRLAFGEAMKAGHDFYLWLNDDVTLFSDAITNLFATFSEKADRRDAAMVVIGSCCDASSGQLTYGGRRYERWHPLRLPLIDENPQTPAECDTMNGNVVLISRAAADAVGNIDPRFTHTIGDIDYGLRARRRGIPIWVAPGFVGSCQRNDRVPGWMDPNRSLSERFRALNMPLDLPIREWVTFAWRHFGVMGIAAAIAAYRRLLFPLRSGRHQSS